MKAILLFILVFLSACSIKTTDISQEFILKSNEQDFNQSFKTTDKTLKILDLDLPLYLNSKNITYIKDDISDIYAYHFWADTPNNLLRFMLLDKLERSHLFKTLIGKHSKINADIVLEGRIDSFEQILKENDNYAKINISLNLIDVKNNALISHKYFTIKEKITNNTPREILKAFEIGCNKLSNEVIIWINDSIQIKE
ncbi:membrane integrity-associated transporter subunit PqiC [Campylobacter sp. TTU-622]|uniref:ABC-type transport auxiliary lipoprotein family protein n=1 Tax=unclassified Campylobacter TaxID=2593542 RepID=UPI001906EED0|nr:MULTISPECIES: ABC-type transport auxiliary lipoprotein family protein [unclassified Campylobacter]MBK1971360.1 membrane integrity-associated transporter subunit PqiC [Campylobacter sp. TTU_617]MBK1972533.1 membrane integrity-associated transporter subunit PqiC [Campylobacter sp. TTU-622]MBK1991033.1 membrane integrity-associated transporter subunit PqiC [Campylobacter sp. 2018MI34]